MKKSFGLVFLVTSLLLNQAVLAKDIKILTNHIGYETIGDKHAVVLGQKNSSITKFQVLDYDTDKVVFSGDAKKVGPSSFKTISWKGMHSPMLFFISEARDVPVF